MQFSLRLTKKAEGGYSGSCKTSWSLNQRSMLNSARVSSPPCTTLVVLKHTAPGSGQGKGDGVVDMAELVGNTEGFADSG